MSIDKTGQEEPENMQLESTAEEIQSEDTALTNHIEPTAETAPAPEDDTPPLAEDAPPTVEAVAEAEAASTIEELDEAVSATDVEEPAEEPAAAAEPGAAVETPVPERAVRYRRGELVEGVISKTTPLEIRVRLDDETEGLIPGRELERMSRQTLETLREGEAVTVYVVNPHDHQGRTILSINRALEELDWKNAEEFRASQKPYEGSVAGYNKGGLIVRFGRLRGFVPQSQISEDRRRSMGGATPEELYGGMVNDNIVVKVMEVDRSRNRLILSERAASRERRERRKAALIEELEVSQVCEGHVVSLEDFGAFVDVGGAEGLVHLTEISWKHVTHPRDVLQVGQKVKVEVISIDRERKRIGLSIKRQEADPWDEVATTYQVGDLVQATVTKLTKFGAFAQLVNAEEIEGLIHISELSDQRVNHPREVVSEDEKLTLRVVKIDVKNRRLGLSLKRVNSAEYLDRDLQTFASAEDDE